MAIDGNDSLKRIAKVGDHEVADTRVFSDSDYFLSREFVDRYAHEVPQRLQKAPPVNMNIPDDDVDDLDGAEDPTTGCDNDNARDGGDPTDGGERTGDNGLEDCVNNWKAAADDNKKRSWGIFDENGVFAMACRHGFLLWIADMVKSGERYGFNILY